MTTAAAVIAVAILAVLAVSASAVTPPTPPLLDGVPTNTQPATPGDIPVPPVVTVPDTPAPPTTTTTLQPVSQLQALLLKRVRSQIVLYHKSTWHWQSLMGLRRSPGENIWALGSAEAGMKLLHKWQSRSHQLHAAARRMMRQRIQQDRQAVEQMRLVMGLRPVVRALASSASIEEQFLQTRRLKTKTQQRYSNPPYASQLMCIHGHEGSWTDTDAPFWGGLQMNRGFMASYGGWLLEHKGTADHWTPLEQIWVAVKAVESGRGFQPWPNTARMCGLL